MPIASLCNYHVLFNISTYSTPKANVLIHSESSLQQCPLVLIALFVTRWSRTKARPYFITKSSLLENPWFDWANSGSLIAVVPFVHLLLYERILLDLRFYARNSKGNY